MSARIGLLIEPGRETEKLIIVQFLLRTLQPRLLKKIKKCSRLRTRVSPVAEKLATECKGKSMEINQRQLEAFGAPLEKAGGIGKRHKEEQKCSGNYASNWNRKVITMEGSASFEYM